jgi:hypothetical protein
MSLARPDAATTIAVKIGGLDFGGCVPPCYKSGMKTTERWLLFKYVGTDLTPLSKPFKTKELAEKARLKFSERERRAIGLGVIRTPG